MLTVDLVRARRKKDKTLAPAYLAGPAAERLYPIARYYVETHEAKIGFSRDDIDESLDAIEVPARDRVASLGLRKVIEDRCVFEIAEGVDPEKIREALFWAAARAHKALDVRAEFDRAAVLAEVSAALGLAPELIEAGLYADLRGSEVLKSFETLTPAAAIERYNLGLAQAILLRATRVTVRIEGEDPRTYRRIFRAARFHQLIHVVRPLAEGGYVIELDGPFSLFDSVQRYGFRLALFLPSILACRSFELRGDILWGKEREPFVFTVSPADGLVSCSPDPPDTTPELEAFCAAFTRLESEWTVAQSDRIFALPGEEVCVPDLVFENRETGEEVYLEVFGFWSRAAVWRRVEQIRRGGLPCRILLAVGKQLRVSEEVLGEEDAGELYVYKATISPRAVLDRLRGEKRSKK
ncbi:Hypothetical protein A7982_11183 [Minicystis rosea]|nr:Hypothetical protein A7982_11183 [Minicystis rosea]